MELNYERAWTSFFQEISITWKYKLGLTWTEKSLYINGSTLKTPRQRHITLCLLSGRSQVQLPPGTPVLGQFKLGENYGALTNYKDLIFRVKLYRFSENATFDVTADCN